MEHDNAGKLAHRRSLEWRESLGARPVPPEASIEEVRSALGEALPDDGLPVDEVVEQLATACDPGVTAMPSGQFFGFVIGGTPPGGARCPLPVSAGIRAARS